MSIAALTQAYRDILQRAPDPGGLEHYRKQVEGGRSVQDIRTEMLGSPEFRSRLASGDLTIGGNQQRQQQQQQYEQMQQQQQQFASQISGLTSSFQSQMGQLQSQLAQERKESAKRMEEMQGSFAQAMAQRGERPRVESIRFANRGTGGATQQQLQRRGIRGTFGRAGERLMKISSLNV